ncbi:MAG: CocE/NonD family hydrolase, partial [Bryobacteraceae bacterium]
MILRTATLLIAFGGITIGLQMAAAQEAGVTIPKSASHYNGAMLSKPQYKVVKEANVRVPMRDKVTLAADIYRPDAPGKFPAILERTPYSRANAGESQQGHFWAERGYVYITMDVRGRYDSDGHYYAYKNEANDGYDSDEWIGKQPWFAGKLGTIGGSYVGYTQWAQAVRGSKYLKTSTQTVTTPDIYGNWTWIDGVLHYGFTFPWGTGTSSHVGQFGGDIDWAPAYFHLPVATSDEAVGRHVQFVRDWVSHPTRDSYWDGISFEKDYNKIGIPILSVDGWYDIFLRGALQADTETRKLGKTEEARTGKRLIIGPWAHQTGGRFATPSGRSDGNDSIDFGDNAPVNKDELFLSWYDHWLKGVKNGVGTEAPFQIFVMGENYWRNENEWPLARTKWTNYYIQSGSRANSMDGDGVLTPGLPAGSATDKFTYDPANPVPSKG